MNVVKNKQKLNTTSVRYLPLGDSYTIGEGIKSTNNFPSVLTNTLREEGIVVEIVQNPAVTGYTTQDLINEELSLLDELKPNFCTLLIGVNDWVQERSKKDFERDLRYILQKVQQQVQKQLVVIAIPDFSIAPEGNKYAKGRDISEGLAEFNSVVKELCVEYSVEFVDIFPLSQQQNTVAYFASDQLHPSEKAYREWVKLILPKALKVLAPFHQLDE